MKGKGVWYEQKRKRWRVRLYHNNEVVHRSYHRSEAEANAALDDARQKQVPKQRDLTSVEGQIAALRERR